MLVQLHPGMLVAVNIAAWLAVHLGAAWLGTRMPRRWFGPGQWLYLPRRWERGGRFYRRGLRMNEWKRHLPDGAALFRGGFRKKRLTSAEPAYLEAFVRETCRGEAVHWAVFACSPLFFLWNPWWAGLLMVGYGAAANLPCIVTQRFNRFRMVEILARRKMVHADNAVD